MTAYVISTIAILLSLANVALNIHIERRRRKRR